LTKFVGRDSTSEFNLAETPAVSMGRCNTI
jgi:hypothetical protein